MARDDPTLLKSCHTLDQNLGFWAFIYLFISYYYIFYMVEKLLKCGGQFGEYIESGAGLYICISFSLSWVSPCFPFPNIFNLFHFLFL